MGTHLNVQLTRKKIRPSEILSEGLFVGLPFLIYLLHVLQFGDWIIDDAGISFAYARNLALGYGLVSQPGVTPVEGFSNPTWVLLLTPFFLWRAFDPVLTPKLLSVVLILASFVLIRLTLGLVSPRAKLLSVIVLLLLAVNSSFAIWTASGLENALSVFLTVAGLYLMTRSWANASTSAVVTLIGLVAALIALTRPEGVLYALIFPLLTVTDVLIRKRHSARRALIILVRYAAVFLLIFGGYVLFRMIYFGALVPNTFFAKVGGLSYSLLSPHPYMLGNAYSLFNSIAPGFAIPFVMALAALTGFLFWTRRFDQGQLILFLFLLTSLFGFSVLPPDWMGEFRFGTAWFVFAYLCTFVTLETALSLIKSSPLRTTILISALAFVLTLPSVLSFADRTLTFKSKPTVPFKRVAETMAIPFNEYARRLNLADASLLVPDAGGTLFYSNLRIYDLGGLTDRQIARTLGRDRQALHDYILQETKPTFIHVHGVWARDAYLDGDPRFRRDYVPIYEKSQKPAQSGVTVYDGDYVRKEAVTNQPAVLRELQAEASKSENGVLP